MAGDILSAQPVSRDRTANATGHVFYVGVSDETNVLSILGDGDAAAGAKGVVVLGSDGTNVQALKTDTNGLLEITQLTASLLNAQVTGDVAHDGADAGNPIKIGGYASATAPTDVSADADRVNAWFDLAGRQAIFDGGQALKISADGNDNSELNPIYVQQAVGTNAGEIHDSDQATDVGVAGTADHDYVITSAKTMLLTGVLVAAAGAAKYEIQHGTPAGSFTTVGYAFTGPGHLTEQVTFNPPVEHVGDGTDVIRIVKSNLEDQTMNIYSTIIGKEI